MHEKKRFSFFNSCQDQSTNAAYQPAAAGRCNKVTYDDDGEDDDGGKGCTDQLSGYEKSTYQLVEQQSSAVC